MRLQAGKKQFRGLVEQNVLSNRRMAWLFVLVVLTMAACEHKPSKEEEEAAKNTFACKQAGQRLVIRFDAGEARMLTSAGERITLYQIPTASGVRYSNGNVELRGKGEDLTLIEFGTPIKLDDCQPYSAPKP
jgi:membrane-bound inhibitor of C-type lysozyme